MALVVSSDVEREIERIMRCKNAFEVLEINPRQCDNALVVKQFNTKVTPLKPLFRSRTAMQARKKLEDAKMRLLDDGMRAKEVEAFNSVLKSAIADRDEIERLERRTRLLEMQAESLLNDQKTS
ncbi:hypothetical protein STCU_00256 [Strigomonas culicis]|uniref:Uncharacterized protein n=1 Tax=Strigomonas culicis TaxID=28005 RepID=S9UYG5_9TRYP|nr:hypothetical protein STCU_01883 [Strigomonas culicis]EPY37041.1 hypothetical protein STCU_00256 [Strigomonas culicis]|eukprot:EPY33883.1 hypothetical protein STCU_01883 [Strigomonas culicis]